MNISIPTKSDFDIFNLINNLPLDWQQQLSHILNEDFVHNLSQFLTTENHNYTIYPPQEQLFAALCATNFYDVRVVIIGQDPYHKQGQANGLAFAVHDNYFPKPPSLRRILKEVEADCQCILNKNLSSLLGWAQQGVLLLNTTLTVRSANPLSHQKQGWEQFTDSIILKLTQRSDPIIFLLWGKHAQTKQTLIHPPHFVLTAPHPSPLAQGFQGCKHFTKVNEILTSVGKNPIDWTRVSL